jgi:hypothetical protein
MGFFWVALVASAIAALFCCVLGFGFLRNRRKPPKLLPFALALLASSPAWAGSATATLPITIQAPLVVSANPPNPTVACNAAPGTAVAALSVTGGNGNPVTYQATAGDTTDFTTSGANLVVAPNGINPNNCGKTNNVAVTATQP